MTGRLAALLERPLRERERNRLFAVTSLALVLAAAALQLVVPAHQEGSTSTSLVEISASAAPSGQPLQSRSSTAPPAAVLRASRQFLSDYLAFLYGHARTRMLRAASASLAHRLASHPPHVSPAMRRRRPHVVKLAGHRLATRSRWALTATIADGAVRYPIELVLAARSPGGAVVVGLGEV